MRELEIYIKSAIPLIHIPTIEIERAKSEVRAITSYFNQVVLPKSDVPLLKQLGFSYFEWNPVDGLTDGNTTVADLSDYVEALKYILNEINNPAIIAFEHKYQENPYTEQVIVTILRKLYAKGKYSNIHIVFIGDSMLPPDIRPYFVTMDFTLPDKEGIKKILKTFSDEVGKKFSKDEIDLAINACQGMTQIEIENALAVSMVSAKRIDKRILYEEKAKAVKKSGLLEWIYTEDTLDNVGGLTNLKDWFSKIAKAFKHPDLAQKYNLPTVKGALICGISGTGKTLCAKAIANLFNVPLFRLDVGRVFNSLVGETERNTRELFKLIDAVSPCVVLIDEIEKGLAGLQSSGVLDSGVTARFIGSLLYYMQEKTSQSFFVCTANDVTKLPPELLRKGRFDEIWYVGLPSISDIEEIISIHLKKVGRNPEKFNIKKIARCMINFTGAEVESTIKEAMYKAFFEDREITTEDIIESAKGVIPLAKTKQEDIRRLEEWAKGRAKRANLEEVKEKVHPTWLVEEK